MSEEHVCLMPLFAGQADRQSLDELNRLLDEGWRIAGIDPTLQPMGGVGNYKAFFVRLMRPAREPERVDE
jgi:hypothetical protein